MRTPTKPLQIQWLRRGPYCSLPRCFSRPAGSVGCHPWMLAADCGRGAPSSWQPDIASGSRDCSLFTPSGCVRTVRGTRHLRPVSSYGSRRYDGAGRRGNCRRPVLDESASSEIPAGNKGRPSVSYPITCRLNAGRAEAVVLSEALQIGLRAAGFGAGGKCNCATDSPSVVVIGISISYKITCLAQLCTNILELGSSSECRQSLNGSCDFRISVLSWSTWMCP